jgi:enoyl-CoA hydratase/carnithine racemase
MGYELIKVEKKERLTIVTINRPEVMNAISPPTSAEMDRAFNEFDADPDAWICIITGAGDRAFSAGNDLKYQVQHGVRLFQALYRRGQRPGARRRLRDRPGLRHHHRDGKCQFRIP